MNNKVNLNLIRELLTPYRRSLFYRIMLITFLIFTYIAYMSLGVNDHLQIFSYVAISIICIPFLEHKTLDVVFDMKSGLVGVYIDALIDLGLKKGTAGYKAVYIIDLAFFWWIFLFATASEKGWL